MADDLARRLAAILAEADLWHAQDDTSTALELTFGASDAAGAVYELRHAVGWTSLRDRLRTYLADDDARVWWEPARTVLWRGASDGLPLGDDAQVVAWLLRRFPDTDEGDMIRSLAGRWRGVSVDSDDDPMADPELRALRGMQGPSVVTVQALDDALLMWRQTRHPDVAFVVRALSNAIDPGPEVPGGPNAQDQAAWLAVARTGSADRLPALLDSLPSGTVTHAVARLHALLDREPDPRIAEAVRGWCMAGHYRRHPVEHAWWVAVEEALTDGLPADTDFGRLADEVLYASPRVGRDRRAISEFVRGMVSAAPAPSPLSAPQQARLDGWLTRFRAPVAPVEAAVDLEALLDAVLDDLEDDDPRWVLADRWLEMGDPRGEFVRLQLERAKRYPHVDQPPRPPMGGLPRPEQALLKAHGGKWFGEGFMRLCGVEPQRGFPAFVAFERKLRDLPDLIGDPGFGTLRTLVCRHPQPPVPQAVWFELLRHPRTRNLRWLDLPLDAVEGLPTFACAPTRVSVVHSWRTSRRSPAVLGEPLADVPIVALSEAPPDAEGLGQLRNPALALPSSLPLAETAAVCGAVASSVQVLHLGSPGFAGVTLRRDGSGRLLPSLEPPPGETTGEVHLSRLSLLERPSDLVRQPGVRYVVQPYDVPLLAELPEGPIRMFGGPWSLEQVQQLPPVTEVVVASLERIVQLERVSRVPRIRIIDPNGDELLLLREDGDRFQIAHLWGGHARRQFVAQVLDYVWPQLTTLYWGGPRWWMPSIIDGLRKRGGPTIEAGEYPQIG